MAEVDAPPGDRITELEMQVATSPDDVPARLELVGALIDADRAVEAMVHAETIMSGAPDNPAGYAAAARCAEAIGDRRAASYAHVARALENFVDEDVPDVWSGFVPPDTTPDGARRTAKTPPSAPAAPAAGKGPADAVEHPNLTLRNIIGVEQVKRRIHALVVQPALAAEGRAQSAVLMFGPAGCGKSFFARAIAGELKAAFLPVDIGTGNTWVGDPRETVHRIFQAARNAAPCVVFLNDIEHAGRDTTRGDTPQVDRALVSRLASELANTAANRGILVLAGSTAPWDVDVALRAGGAIDRSVLVGPPDAEAREAILRYQFQSVPLAGVDISWIVDRTQHFSGTDLLALCERAQALAVADSSTVAPSVGPGHMTRALREVRPSAPAWFGAVMEHAISSNHGGMYDDVLTYIDEHRLA